MIRILIPAAALIFISAAASASIAPRREQAKAGRVYEPARDPGISRQAERIGDRIEQGRERGQLTRGEARGLKKEARLLSRLHARYAGGGLSASERRELQARIDYLNGAISARRTERARTARPAR
jgi:hypothetical protein